MDGRFTPSQLIEINLSEKTIYRIEKIVSRLKIGIKYVKVKWLEYDMSYISRMWEQVKLAPLKTIKTMEGFYIYISSTDSGSLMSNNTFHDFTIEL